MFKNIKLISFDLFDTLVYYKKEDWKWFCLRSGIWLPSQIRSFKRTVQSSVITDMYLWEILEKEKMLSQTNMLRFKRLLKKEVSSISTFSDIHLLTNLQKKGYKIAVTSNLSKDFGAPALALLPIKPDYTIFSFEVGCRKPEKNIFDKLSQLSSIQPEHILHIGDNYKNDYLGAKEAGLNSIQLVRNCVAITDSSKAVDSLYTLLTKLA